MDEKNTIYVKILIDSLQKKKQVLHNIFEITTQQSSLLEDSDFDLDAFNATIDEKQDLINLLDQIDNGFEQVYERLKDDFAQNKHLYQSHITQMQSYISEITDYSVNLQAMEEKNRMKLQTCLSGQRKQIKNMKVSNNTAASYYKNMANQHQGQSYFLDKKK
jgi:hypothetical protein